jgi:hypothetical protein
VDVTFEQWWQTVARRGWNIHRERQRSSGPDYDVIIEAPYSFSPHSLVDVDPGVLESLGLADEVADMADDFDDD